MSGHRTWDSLWPLLLLEASRSAAAAAQAIPDCMGRAAAAVVLALVSWEAYINELIEWRKLPGSLKRQKFQEKLDSVLVHVAPSEAASRATTIWPDLALLNQLRNTIVHHKAAAAPLHPTDHPLVHALVERGVIPQPEETMSWERLLLLPSTAIWGCKLTGEAIVTMEGFHFKRARSFQSVCHAVRTSLHPIEEAHQ